ncbi:MAG: hypothetical protein AAFN11_04080 [Chloroflexota bacterium]
MFQDRLRQALVALLALSQFITPFLFQNDFDNTPSEVPLYLLPAGYAFIVWLVIWLTSAAYATYQLRPDQTKRELHRRIGFPLSLNMIFFNVWLWAQEAAVLTATDGLQNPIWLVITQLILTGMLATHIYVFREISNLKNELTSLDMWLVQVPAAIYFAWLTAAYSTGVATAFYEAGWVGVQVGIPLTIAILGVVALITGRVIASFNTKYGAVAYGAVIIWAVISIGVQNVNQSILVVGAALMVALILLGVTVYSVNKSHSFA